MHQFWIHDFPSKNHMNKQMITWQNFMQCLDGFGKFMSWEELCKKEHSIWSYVAKVMPCWTFMYTLWSFAHNFSTIHQMIMILDFWKEERKIFNFHVDQKFIWSFFDVGKSSWMWSKNLPFLETWNYRSLSILGNFCNDFKIFKIDVWHDE